MSDAGIHTFPDKSRRNMIFSGVCGNRIQRCIIIIASVVLAIQGRISQQDSEITQAFNTCWHSDCTRTAYAILNTLNFSAPPCDDFYEYACGQYQSRTNNYQIEGSLNYRRELKEITERQLKEILEEPISNDDGLLEHKAKLIYATCMNIAKANQKGTALLKKLVDYAGGWPMIEAVNDINLDNISWVDVHTLFHRLTGTGSLINVIVYGDRFTNNIPVVHLDQPVTIYGKYYKVKKSKYKTYRNYIRDLALEFIAPYQKPIATRKLEKDANDVMAFRKKLTKIMSWGNVRRNEVRKNNKFTFEIWQEQTDRNAEQYNYSNINWLGFVNATFSNNIPLQSSQEIIVSEPNYLTNLLVLLNSTSVQTILNHMFLHFMERHVKYTTTKMMAKVNDINEQMTGIPRVAERWRLCLFENPMQHVVGRMYSRRYLRDDTPQRVKQLADDIRSELINEISSAPWMDDKTKAMAVRKLEKMKVIAGYPEFYDDELQMQRYYGSIPACSDYLSNALAYAQNEFRLTVTQLLDRGLRDVNDNLPFEANTFYLVTQNALQINAGKLQWPFYEPNLPDVVLYARLGVSIGHEMGHAFDVFGRHFDEHGLPNNWWESNSTDEYDDRIDCIAHQYLQYEVNVGDYKLQPNWFDIKRTSLEDVADAIGIRAAINAFKNKSRRSAFGPTTKLPHLDNFSDMQMFFLSAATSLCEKFNPLAVNGYVRRASHSLPQFRVRGQFSNAPEFSEAFNCEPGAIMNPEEKCSIWE